MRIAIVGSRDIADITEEFIYENLPDNCTQIISGGAVGIDFLAKKMAEKYHLEYTEFLPDYSSYGKSAPLVRNCEIIENADYVLAFWNHKSSGTQQVILECLKRSIPIKIVSI